MYNDRHFRPSEEVIGGPAPTALGTIMNAEFVTVDGKPVRLSDFRGKTLVLETGSVTCPIYANLATQWHDVVAAHPDVEFRMVYVREAHPGKKIDAHRSLEEKCARGKEVLERYDDRREVWVDDVEGTFHKAIGVSPNVLVVIDPEGRLVYHAWWSDPAAAKKVLDRMATGDRGPFTDIEALDVIPSPAYIAKIFAKAGARTFADFVPNLPRLLWKRRIYRRWRKKQAEGAAAQGTRAGATAQ